MNEEAINDAYTLFKGAGYKKSIDEFKNLLNTNKEALSDAYVLFQGAGYKKSIDDFSSLMGIGKADTVVKKKESESSFQEDIMGPTIPGESKYGFSDLGEPIEKKPKTVVGAIIDNFTVDLDNISDEDLSEFKVDKDLSERAAVLGSESPFFNKFSDETAKAKYIKSQAEKTAKSIDDYYRDKIQSDLFENEEFVKISKDIESNYLTQLEQKRVEIVKKSFNKEISGDEARKIYTELSNKAKESIARDKANNETLSGLYSEAISKYEDEWRGSIEELSDKADTIVEDIDANSFWKPIKNAVLQNVYGGSLKFGGALSDRVSGLYSNFDPNYDKLEYDTTKELAEIAGVDFPDELGSKPRNEFTVSDLREFTEIREEVKKTIGKTTYKNFLQDKEREFFRQNPEERTAIANFAADLMDSAEAFDEMADTIGLTTRVSDIRSAGDFGDWAWNTITQLGAQVGMSAVTKGGFLFAQGIGNTYYDSVKGLADEHKEKTGEDLTMREALDLADSRLVASSIATGITVGALEKFGLGKVLSKAPIVKKVITEAGTESLQTTAETIGVEVGMDKSFNEVGETLKSAEFWSNVGESAAAGAFGGGLLGGATNKFSKPDELKLSTITADEDLKNMILEEGITGSQYAVGDAPKTRVEINEIIENAKSIEDLEGISVNNDKGIEDKLASKAKELQDAIQEQETRDIPEAERAEGVQEVETEVREPSLEEKKKEIDLRRQEELEPVRTDLSRLDQTGELPTADGKLVNEKNTKNKLAAKRKELLDSIDDINAKYDAEISSLDKEAPAQKMEESSKVSDAIGSTVFINDRKGTIKIDETEGAGKKVIFESEDGNQIVDIGDIDIIGNRPIGDFNLKQEVGTDQEQATPRAEGETVINTEGDVVTSPEGVQEGPEKQGTFIRERKDGTIVIKDDRGLERRIKGKDAQQFNLRFPNPKKGDSIKFQVSPKSKLESEFDSDLEEIRLSRQQKGGKSVSISDKKSTSELKKKQKDRKKADIISFAERAINTLKSVLPNFEIYIHETSDSYNSFIDSVGAPKGSRGNFSYRKNKDGELEGRIDINLSIADKGTVAHEIAHGILMSTLDGSPQLYKDFRGKISSVLSSSTNKELNDFANQYVDKDGNLLDVNHEEYLVQLAALMSVQGKSLPTSTISKIAKIINQLISNVTNGKFKPFENTSNKNDILEYFNSISRAISEGSSLDGVTEKINIQANPTGTKVDTKSLESKSSLIQGLGLKRFPDMKGRIKTGITLKEIGPVVTHLTFSDRLVTGKVGNNDYLGGILFASATNRVWASFSKGRVNQVINGMPLNEDGYRYLMPALLTQESHMSNKDMTNTSIALVEKSVESNSINPEEANKRILKSLNRKGLEKSKDVYSEYIKSNGISPKSISDAIDKSLSNTTFEQRKRFLESLLGKADIDKSKRFGDLPSYGELANGLAEPMTLGHDYGDVLLSIRTKGDLVAVQPKKGDPDYHPSYPWVIRSINKDGSIADVETLIFNESYSAVDVFPQVTNKQGKTLTYDQYVEKYGDGAKSRYLGYIGGRSTMSTSLTEQVRTEAQSSAPTELRLEDMSTKQQISDPKVKSFIDKAKAKGYTDAEIRDALINIGVSNDVIDASMAKTPTAKTAPKKNNVSEDFKAFATRNNIQMSKGIKGVIRNIRGIRSLRFEDVKLPFKKDPVSLVIGNPDVGISLGETISYYRKSLFSAKKFFSESLFKNKELKEAFIAKQLNIVEQNRKALNRAMKKIKASDDDYVQLDLFLRGLPNELNEDVVKVATEMRQHVDILSETLIANGWVADSKEYVIQEISKDGNNYFAIDVATGKKIKLSENQISNIKENGKDPKEGETVFIRSAVEGNLGSYLTRSYEIFDRNNWKDKVEDVIVQRAKNLYRNTLRPVAEKIQPRESRKVIRERLESQYSNEADLNKAVEDEYNKLDGEQITSEINRVLENLVDNKIDEILATNNERGFLKKGKLGSKDLSILKERNDIPLEIRMLMGEYTDPLQNYARTILKQASLISNQRFLEKSRDIGLGKFFFEPGQPRPRGFDFQIAAEGSETMSPLNGLYTTKEIAEQFEQAEGGTLDPFWQNYMKAVSTVKWMKTIASFAAQMKNIFGNLGFMSANGHWRISEMREAYKIIRNDLGSKSNKELNDLVNRYTEISLIKQSTGLNEIRDMFKDANFDDALYKRTSKKPTTLGKGVRAILTGKKLLEDIYGGTDDFFKIVAFENEMTRYADALYGKPKSQLNESEVSELQAYVAEIVKNTYPTYSRVPEAIQLIRRFPLIGTFVSFQAESWRVAYNTMAIANKEIRSENPRIRKIGAQRLAGTISYLAIKDTFVGYMSYSAGMGVSGLLGSLFDDEEQKEKDRALSNYVAPWSRNSDIMVLSSKDGKIRYIDISSSDPYGGIAKVINAFSKGEDLADKSIEGFIAAIEPFIGVDIATSVITQLTYNDNGYGGRIYNPEDPDRYDKMLSFVLNKTQPGTAASVRKFLDSENKGEEIFAQVLGLRITEVDLVKSFSFKFVGGNGYKQRISDAKALSRAKYDKNAKLTEYLQEEKTVEETLNGIYSDIHKDFKDAVLLGADVNTLMKKMKDLGLSREAILSVIVDKK